MGNSHKNLLLRNHWANCNQTFVEWSLDGPLPKLCPVIPTSNKMVTKLKIEKRQFSSETNEPISTKLYWNDRWVVPFQNYVWHFRPPTKMAATAELNLTWDPMGNSHKNRLVWNQLLNKNKILMKYSLDGSLPKMCPAVRPFDQDGSHSRT
jgi:hypothetical protein